ncbi:general substrate transporter [Morchella snyderi]|nr:general substrate transporter [Morchella snyderi]
MSAVATSRLDEIRSVVSGPIMILGLVASMGGFLFGADTGQVSGFIIMEDFMKRFAEDRGLGVYAWSQTREGLIVGMLSIGALIGALAAGPLGNSFGRKKAMIGIVFVYFIGNTISISAQHAWYQIIIGRVFSGIAIGALSSLVPVYVSETVPKQVRGAMVASYQLFVTCGLLTSYCVNLGTSRVSNSGEWRGPLAIGYFWASSLMVGMFFLPESPRWLLANDKSEECLAALRFIAGAKNRDKKGFIESEYQDIEALVREAAAAGKASFFSSFDPKGKALYRTLLGFMLMVCQQLTGANYFFYYGASIFKSVGISNSFATQIILGAVNVVCTFPGLWFIEKFGRRKTLIGGALWQMAWLLIFGAIGSEKDPSEKSIGGVLILCACMFIASFASTWGPGTWVCVGEMYPLRTRSHSSAIATTGNWMWNFLLTFFTPFITKAIGYKYGYVFAGCNCLAAIIVYFFLYESSNLSLEQVEDMYNDPNVNAWNSSKWVPHGLSSRSEAVDVSKEQQAIAAGVFAEAQHDERVTANKAYA